MQAMAAVVSTSRIFRFRALIGAAESGNSAIPSVEFPHGKFAEKLWANIKLIRFPPLDCLLVFGAVDKVISKGFAASRFVLDLPHEL